MRVRSWLLVLLIGLAVSSIAGAQTLTGTIVGKVTDSSGLAVPGATVTVTSPALIRAYTAVSNEKGDYRAINLPPGTYQVGVTLDGFQPVTVKGLVVTVGTVVQSDIALKPANLAETINVVAEAPTVDLQQTKNTQTITKEALNAVPLKRDPISAMQITPGVVERSVAGSSRNEMAYLVDGTNQNAPDQGYAEANVNWDTIEQIEFITTGNPAENYGVVGGALNIVTKSGGNMLSGSAQYYFTNKSLAQIVLPPEYRSAMKVGAAAAPLFDRDFSATLGGPIKKDSTWFFGSYKHLEQEILGSFIPTTIWGKQYDNYNAPYTQNWFTGKVTQQLTDKIRAFVMYNYSKGDRPHEFSVPAYRTLESTRHWMSKEGTLSSNLTWILGPKTVLDARFGFWRFDYFGLAQSGSDTQNHVLGRVHPVCVGRVPARRHGEAQLHRVGQDREVRRRLARQPRPQGRVGPAARVRLLDFLDAERHLARRVERRPLRQHGAGPRSSGVRRRHRLLRDLGREPGRQLLRVQHDAVRRLRPGHLAP